MSKTTIIITAEITYDSDSAKRRALYWWCPGLKLGQHVTGELRDGTGFTLDVTRIKEL